MRADLLRLRRSADDEKPAQRGEPGEPRLWNIGVALAVGFGAAALGLAGLTWAAWALLYRPKTPHPQVISLHDTVGVLQLVFASVAGAGALVALIVAYRRQKIAEADSAHDRTRVFNERFTTIAAQLGDDQPAIRLAGVHAMAGLADDWKENRQTCIDVLCAYLRMPYDPDPGQNAPAPKQLKFRAGREVRQTVIRVITTHLKDGAPVSWQGRDFDFTGVVFDGGDFSSAVFSRGEVSFADATFSGQIGFVRAEFSGGLVSFYRAEFSGREVDFGRARFCGGTVAFVGAQFTGGMVAFGGARFSKGEVSFAQATFSSGGRVTFPAAEFCGGEVDFSLANFCGGEVVFRPAGKWSHPPKFDWDDPSSTAVKPPQVELP